MRFSIGISVRITSGKTAAIGSREPPSQCGRQLCCDLEIFTADLPPKTQKKAHSLLEKRKIIVFSLLLHLIKEVS